MLRILGCEYRAVVSLRHISLRQCAHPDWIAMSEFPHFDNAKLMIAASARHCRTTIEDLPVGQIVVDEAGTIQSIDVSTEMALGFENIRGMRVLELLLDGYKCFPQKLSLSTIGDLGSNKFCSRDGKEFSARIVCVPGSHPKTFLLSIVFA